jgi:hypothetical protein
LIFKAKFLLYAHPRTSTMFSYGISRLITKRRVLCTTADNKTHQEKHTIARVRRKATFMWRF